MSKWQQKWQHSATKAKKTRSVHISWELYAELDVIRKDPEQYVFNLVSRSQTRKYKVLQRACKKLGIVNGGLHTFRMSRATEIYRRCGIKVAAQMLGDSEGIALKHYIEEVGPEQIRKEARTGKPVPRTRKQVPSKPFPSKRKRSGGSGGLPPPGYQSGKKKGGEAPRSPRLRAKRAGGFLTLLLARELSNEIGGALVQGQQSSLIRMGDTYFW